MANFNLMTGLVFGPVFMTDDSVHGPFDMSGMNIPLTIDVYVASGDTVTLSISCDGGVHYPAAITYALTSADRVILTSGVTHVKFARTAGTGTTSAVSMC